MKAGRDYIDSVNAMKSQVCAYGEKVQSLAEHPCFRPAINGVALTYDIAKKQNNFMKTYSPFIGSMVNRFIHICTSPEDLIKRAQMGNFLTPLHGARVGARCVGTAALNALYATTYEMDEQLGTAYHQRFLNFLKCVQEEDLTVCGMVTDPKGDR